MRKILLAVFVIATFVFSSPARASWPIKEFKVFLRPPSENPGIAPPLKEELGTGWWESLTLADDYEAQKKATAEQLQPLAKKIEALLAKVVSAYEQEGFEQPGADMMTTVVDEDGKQKFAAYLYSIPETADFDVGAKLRNPGACQGKPQWLEIDVKNLISGHQDSDLYKTLAHEVFHAIQGHYDKQHKSLLLCDYPVDRNDALSTIMEGGADGAAEYLTSQDEEFKDRHSNSNHRKTLGGYPYRYAFFNSPKGAYYYTNSFWRFLAEKYGGLRYMKALLERPIQDPKDKGRIQWLDDGLKSYEPIKKSMYSLYTLFPAAVTEIFSYSPGRYKKTKEEDWVNKWFTSKDGCQGEPIGNQERGLGGAPLKLEPGPLDTKNLPLDPLPPISARCVDIEWGQFGEEVELEIEVIADSEKVADQLHIGVAKLTRGGAPEYCWDWSRRGGGMAGKTSCLYEKPFVQTGPKPEKFAKKWMTEREIFQKPGSARLVIANIAPPPTPKHPNAPGPQSTVEAKGVLLRIGIRHTKSNDGKKLRPASGAPPVRLGSFPLQGGIGQPPS